MKKLIVLLIILLSSSNAFGTAQFPDLLIYKGDSFSLFSNPLESYFGKNNPRPDYLFVFRCTANWRGYVATWKIENENLYLIKLVEGSCDPNARNIDISIIFPSQDLPIKATWFSGTLRIPQGKMLSYIHMGYESIYENDLIITIENGKVINEQIVDNTKGRLPPR